jgi:hypothetical protein
MAESKEERIREEERNCDLFEGDSEEVLDEEIMAYRERQEADLARMAAIQDSIASETDTVIDGGVRRF